MPRHLPRCSKAPVPRWRCMAAAPRSSIPGGRLVGSSMRLPTPLRFPVSGSGDVFTAEDAAEHLRNPGANAVFIARGIYGNPVFGDARALALDGIPVPARSSVERPDALREHLTLTLRVLPLMSRARAVRKLVQKRAPCRRLVPHVVRCSTYEEFMALVDEIEHDVVACVGRPFAASAGIGAPHPLEA